MTKLEYENYVKMCKNVKEAFEKNDRFIKYVGKNKHITNPEIVANIYNASAAIYAAVCQVCANKSEDQITVGNEATDILRGYSNLLQQYNEYMAKNSPSAHNASKENDLGCDLRMCSELIMTENMAKVALFDRANLKAKFYDAVEKSYETDSAIKAYNIHFNNVANAFKKNDNIMVFRNIIGGVKMDTAILDLEKKIKEMSDDLVTIKAEDEKIKADPQYLDKKFDAANREKELAEQIYIANQKTLEKDRGLIAETTKLLEQEQSKYEIDLAEYERINKKAEEDITLYAKAQTSIVDTLSKAEESLYLIEEAKQGNINKCEDALREIKIDGLKDYTLYDYMVFLEDAKSVEDRDKNISALEKEIADCNKVEELLKEVDKFDKKNVDMYYRLRKFGANQVSQGNGHNRVDMAAQLKTPEADKIREIEKLYNIVDDEKLGSPYTDFNKLKEVISKDLKAKRNAVKKNGSKLKALRKTKDNYEKLKGLIDSDKNLVENVKYAKKIMADVTMANADIDSYQKTDELKAAIKSEEDKLAELQKKIADIKTIAKKHDIEKLNAEHKAKVDEYKITLNGAKDEARNIESKISEYHANWLKAAEKFARVNKDVEFFRNTGKYKTRTERQEAEINKLVEQKSAIIIMHEQLAGENGLVIEQNSLINKLKAYSDGLKNIENDKASYAFKNKDEAIKMLNAYKTNIRANDKTKHNDSQAFTNMLGAVDGLINAYTNGVGIEKALSDCKTAANTYTVARHGDAIRWLGKYAASAQRTTRLHYAKMIETFCDNEQLMMTADPDERIIEKIVSNVAKVKQSVSSRQAQKNIEVEDVADAIIKTIDNKKIEPDAKERHEAVTLKNVQVADVTNVPAR